MPPQSIPDFTAMTLKANGIAGAIISEAHISPPIPSSEEVLLNDPRLVKTTALWDTGATVSCITSELAHSLKLIPTGKVKSSHAKGACDSLVYHIDIVLPNRIRVPCVNALEVESVAGNFGIILGMNVITLGDFSITNVGKKTLFSFRVPSLKTIDYVEEIRVLNEKKMKHVGRNDPCPCGSGKKFKHCHWRSK